MNYKIKPGTVIEYPILNTSYKYVVIKNTSVFDIPIVICNLYSQYTSGTPDSFKAIYYFHEEHVEKSKIVGFCDAT